MSMPTKRAPFRPQKYPGAPPASLHIVKGESGEITEDEFRIRITAYEEVERQDRIARALVLIDAYREICSCDVSSANMDAITDLLHLAESYGRAAHVLAVSVENFRIEQADLLDQDVP